ncbi:MAG: transposase [Dehalococcoidia bacterium]|nr:transposase [Dehalococcoidia bacterium]
MVRQYQGTAPNTPCPVPTAGILAKLASIFDVLPDGHLLAHLWEHRRNGRPGYPLQAMWRAYLASFILNLGNTNDLIRRLRDDYPLRELCGFGSLLPHRRTFNRFIQRLAVPHHADMVEAIFTALTNKLKEFIPDLGQELAIDSTFVRSHCSPNSKTKRSGRTEKSDPEASWTAKNSTQAKEDGKEWKHGYKVHMVADTKHEVPLAVKVTTASRNDSPELPDVVDQMLAQLPWLQPTALMADRGYDAYSIFDYLNNKDILPIIRIKQSPHGALKEGIYTKDGVPTCIGKIPMQYVRSEDGKGHLYRCAGCHLKDSKVGMTTHCDTEVWEDPTRNLRLFGPPHIRREGKEWKVLYAKRQGIERIFRSLKAVRRLERHCIRGLDQIRLHTLMSTLAFQATFLINKQAGLGAKEARWMIARVA